MDYERVIRDIQQGRFLPVYVIFGDSPFLRREMLGFVVQEAARDGCPDTDCDYREPSGTAEAAACLELAGIPTFSGGRRVLVIRGGDVFGGKSGDESARDAVCRYLDKPYPESCVIFDVPNLDGRRKTSALAKRRGFLVDCLAPRDERLMQWVERRAAREGKRIGTAAARALIERAGGEPGLLAAEIHKLVTYAGDDPEITMSAVEQVASGDSQGTAFAMIDAVFAGDGGTALHLLGGLVRRNEPPLALLALLHGQLRTLYHVATLVASGTRPQDVTAQVSAHPFVVRKCLERSRRIDERSAGRALVALHETDVLIKTGQREPKLALEMLLCRLAEDFGRAAGGS